MVRNIARQRCVNHRDREAAALCPECKHCYCRECITEHKGRVICAGCLKKLVRPKKKSGFSLSAIVTAAQCFFGLMIAWLFFFYIGQALLNIPTSFHEGTLWKDGWGK